MSKEGLIGLGLVGLPFVCFGAVIGGVVVDKINDKHKEEGLNVWKGITDCYKELLFKSYEVNDRLRRELELKVKA
jgi:hypothetical protein